MRSPIVRRLALLAIAFWGSTASAAPERHQTRIQPLVEGSCPLLKILAHGSLPGLPTGMRTLLTLRLKFLKVKLQIRPSEELPWRQYANAVMGQINVLEAAQNSMVVSIAGGSAPKRMNVRIQSMKAFAGALTKVQPATEALYNELSPEQKTIADQLIGTDCGAM